MPTATINPDSELPKIHSPILRTAMSRCCSFESHSCGVSDEENVLRFATAVTDIPNTTPAVSNEGIKIVLIGDGFILMLLMAILGSGFFALLSWQGC